MLGHVIDFYSPVSASFYQFLLSFLSHSSLLMVVVNSFERVSQDSDAFVSYNRMSWRSMLMSTFSYRFLLTMDRIVRQMSNSLLKTTSCSLHIRH